MVDQSNGLIPKTSERQLSLLARHLPALYTEPTVEPAVKFYPAWTSYINGRKVYWLAAGTNELWCTTSGGVLYWKWSGNAHFTWFGSEHGLRGTHFECVVLDGQGRPWVSSSTSGVCYWDGQTWRYLSSSEGLPSDNITLLSRDQLGTVWIATERGLGYVVWQDEKPKWNLYDLLATGIPTQRPTCLAFDTKNRLYVGTAYGLFTPEQGKNSWRRYTLVDGLPSNQITALHISSDSGVWVGTASGMVQISRNGITRFSEIRGGVHAVYQAPNKDDTWILTSDALWLYQNNSLKHLDSPLVEKAGNIYAITADAEKSWIGSGVGVIEYNQSPALIRTPGVRDLPDGGISCLAIDAQNNLWVGTAMGIWLYQGQEWHFLQPGNQLISSITNISNILPAPDGSVWVGSWQNGIRGGLHSFHGGVEVPFPRRGNPDTVDKMTIDKNGQLVVAASGALFHQLGKDWQTIVSPDPSKSCQSLLVDRNNQIWCGMRSGLYAYKQDCWRKLLGEVQIYAIAQDSEGVVWIGSSQGLYTCKRGKLRPIEINLPSQRIQSLLLTGDTIWIGTPAGLVRFHNNDTKLWDITNSGLVGNNVRSLAMSAEGSLWVGTSSGLCQFKTSEE